MNRICWFTIAAFVFAGTVRADDKELAKLQGVWEVDYTMKTGKKLSADERKKSTDYFLTKVTIKDSSVRIGLMVKDQPEQDGDPVEFKLSTKGKHKVFTTADGGWMAIYQVEGDVLKVCVAEMHEKEPDRLPTSFDTNGNGDWYLFVFKRAKK